MGAFDFDRNNRRRSALAYVPKAGRDLQYPARQTATAGQPGGLADMDKPGQTPAYPVQTGGIGGVPKGGTKRLSSAEFGAQQRRRLQSGGMFSALNPFRTTQAQQYRYRQAGLRARPPESNVALGIGGTTQAIGIDGTTGVDGTTQASPNGRGFADNRAFEGPELPVGLSQVRGQGGRNIGFRYDTHPSEQAEFGRAIYSGTAMGATPQGFRRDVAEHGLTRRPASPSEFIGGESPSHMAERPLHERAALTTGGLGDARAAIEAYERGDIDLGEYTRQYEAGIGAHRSAKRQRSEDRARTGLQRRLVAQIQPPLSAADIKEYADQVYSDAFSRATQQGVSGPGAIKLATEAVTAVLGGISAVGETQQRTGRRAAETLGGIQQARTQAEEGYLLGEQAAEAQLGRDQRLEALKSVLGRKDADPSWKEKEFMKGLAELQRDVASMLITPEAAQETESVLRRIYASGMSGKEQGATTGLSVGAVYDGYRYKGGGPNDRGNWEKAQ